MTTPVASGTIEIRDKTWRWSILGPPASRLLGDGKVFVRFRRADDPPVELRCVARCAPDAGLSDEELRAMFGRAWAVYP
jgi:hypothetical protein